MDFFEGRSGDGGNAIRELLPRLQQCTNCHGRSRSGVRSLGGFIHGDRIADRYTFEVGNPVRIARASQPDLILSAENAVDGRSGIIWLKYADQWDSPDWIAHDISGPEGIKFDISLLLDLDDDGDLDVINTEENNNSQGGNAGLGLVWYENPSN